MLVEWQLRPLTDVPTDKKLRPARMAAMGRFLFQFGN